VTAHDAIYERRRRPAVFRIVGHMAFDIEGSRRAHSVPRPAFGGAMLTLLRVRRVAPAAPTGARRRFPPALKRGLLAASFFLRFLGRGRALRIMPLAQRKDSQTNDRG
jgi:hypothetical protein